MENHDCERCKKNDRYYGVYSSVMGTVLLEKGGEMEIKINENLLDSEFTLMHKINSNEEETVVTLKIVMENQESSIQ